MKMNLRCRFPVNGAHRLCNEPVNLRSLLPDCCGNGSLCNYGFNLLQRAMAVVMMRSVMHMCMRMVMMMTVTAVRILGMLFLTVDEGSRRPAW